MSDLLVSLGLDIQGFKNSANAATEQAKGLKRGFGDLKDVLAAGGVTAAVVGLFRAAIEGAEAAADKLDKNVQAVLRFRDGLQETKGTFSQLAVTVVGLINRFGEWHGRFGAIRELGREQVEQSERIAAQTQQTVANLEKAKEHQAEFEQITKSLARIEQQREELAQKGLTAQERASVLENEYLALLVEQANFHGAAIDRRRLELKTAEARLAMEKAFAEVAKEQAAADKQNAEAARKAADERVKLEQRKADLIFQRLSLEEQVEQLSMRELALQQEIFRAKAQGKDTIEQEVELLEIQAKLGPMREEAAQRAAAAEKQVTQEIQRQNELVNHQIKIRAGADQQLSDRELREKINNLRNQIDQAKIADSMAPMLARGAALGMLPMLEQELRLAQEELSMRKQVRNRLDRYGGDEEMAYRYSGLSATDFERILGIVGNSTEQEKQTRRTADMVETLLRRFFPGG